MLKPLFIQVTTKKFWAAVWLFLGLLVVSGSQALAQSCTFTNTGVNFGPVDLTSGGTITQNGTFAITCTGIPGNRVRVCMNFGAGTGGIDASGDPRTMLNGANTLDYNIYKNGGFSRIWGSHVWALPPTGKGTRVRLNGAGNGSRNIPVRTRIAAGQISTQPGLYVSTFSGGHTYINYRYQSVGNCSFISSLGGGVQVPFTVQADVLAACTLTATDLNFGSIGFLTANQDTSNTLSINCSNSLPYTISLDGGLTGALDPTLRKMTNGVANQITYGIYQNAARTIPWGDNIGTNTVSSTGTGSVQSFTTFGRVPVQSTPIPGTYTDTIVVTVTY